MEPYLYGSLSFARVAVENFRTVDSNTQDHLSLTSDMNISCETTVYMQARCSKAASKLETCFPKLCLEPDDTTVFIAKRPGTTITFKTVGTDRRIPFNVGNISIPLALFSMLLPLAIKFDESERFGVKPNIERGGGRGGEGREHIDCRT